MMTPQGNARRIVRAKLSPLVNATLRRWHQYGYEKEPPTFRTIPHFLLRRKTLLILAFSILLAGAVLRPWSFILLLRSRGFIAVLVAGLLAGALVRELAAVCLGTKGRLWYTRWAAPVFLLAALVAVNTAVHAADRLAHQVLGTGPFLSSGAAAYVLIALELLWIAAFR
jgi:hypothetical protein